MSCSTKNGNHHTFLQELREAHSFPKHVAIIMDGNGRWAKARHLPRVAGHRAGAKAVRAVVEESRRLGIRYLTLFSFSTENWFRPQTEVSALMGLFIEHLRGELTTLLENGVRLRAIGDLERLPSEVQQALRGAMEATAHLSGMDLILAISYGGRDELVHAVQGIVHKIEHGLLRAQDIAAHTIREHLYAPDVPDPDLLIRTSDECRISNFLLWQLAYAEIVVSPALWPDFSVDELHRCLKEFAARVRRFGLTDEQLERMSSKDVPLGSDSGA